MKTPSSPWRLLLVLASVSIPIAGQEAPPNPVMAVSKPAVFSTSYLKESEVDSRPKADETLRKEAERVTMNIVNSKQELCTEGIYRARIELVVDVDGTPKEVQWTSATSAEFADLEVANVQHWHFTPAMLNGRAVPCQCSITERERRPRSFQAVPYEAAGDPYSPASLAAAQESYAPEYPETPPVIPGAAVRTPVFSGPYMRPREVSVRPRAMHDENQVATQAMVTYFRQNGVNPFADSGIVTVAFIVDATGTPTEVQWVQTNNLGLAQFVVQLASRFKYTPAMFNGRAVPCTAGFTFRNN